MMTSKSYRKRVGFDAHVLDGRPQGSVTFIANILRALTKIDTTFQMVIYCAKPDHAQELIGPSAFEYRQLPEAGSAARLMWIFPRLFHKDRIDLGIFQFITPPFGTVPSLVVVHDLLPLTHPSMFPLGFRISRKILFSHSIRRARGVLTVSETAKTEIARLFPDAGRLCTAVFSGSSFDINRYFSPDVPALPAPISPNDQYILTVGRIEKRKNIDLLVRAFQEAKLSGVKLLIVGKQDLGFDWCTPADERIIHLQNVPNDQLLALYRNAALFVFPSCAEGFGVPPLDALLAGAPTISSDQTAMLEIASGLARLFDPTAPDAESALTAMLIKHFDDDPVPRPTLAQREALSRRFDWSQNALRLSRAIEGGLQ